MSNLTEMTDWKRLKEMLDHKSADSKNQRVDEKGMLNHLRTRVKGQDAILSDVTNLIRLQMAKTQKGRPICNLLFLGPTGTGKTELAKAIAEFLYGDEKAILRFDCSEFSGPEAKTRLVGTPTGYSGSELGGHLTRPVMTNPRRVILFDEIEKAYKEVFDLFLQVMGEARLTEQGSGKTVDFSQSIIIFTSNAHAEQIGKIKDGIGDYHEMVNAIKGFLADTNVFRPEILGRIDKVYVFSPLEGMIVAEIALLKISKLAKEYGLSVTFVAPELIMQALLANEKVNRFGIRELERIIFDLFASRLADAKDRGVKTVAFSIGDNGQLALIDSVV